MKNNLLFRNSADKVFMFINENSYELIKNRDGDVGNEFNKESVDIEFTSSKKISIYDQKMNEIKSNFSLGDETEYVETYDLNVDLGNIVSSFKG